MRKSQLRRLALDYAQGHVDHDGYVRERTELIDAIVSGRVDIEREAVVPERRAAAPDAPVATPTADDSPPAAARDGSGSRLSPLHIAIGGVLIAGVATLLLSNGDDPVPAPAPAPSPPPAVVIPAPQAVPPARQLVDAFLADNDWSGDGLQHFLQRWQVLPEDDRREALGAPWFRPLSTAVKQEINAQRALAGLDGGSTARVEGRRLVDFANAVGIAGPFPDFAEPEADAAPSSLAPASDVRPQQAPGPDSSVSESGLVASGLAGQEPASTPPAMAGRTPGTTPAAAPHEAAANAPDAGSPGGGAVGAVREGGTGDGGVELRARAGREWLSGQPPAALLLQLYAVNQLAEVERIMGAHPELDLHVLAAAPGVQPAFRVVRGPFNDRASARDAHAALPANLRGNETPLVRTAAELLDSLAGSDDALAGSVAPAAAEPAAAAAVSALSGGTYTVQLFASPRRDNVQLLIDRYPGLDLRIHQDASGSGDYRVLLGSFESVDAARARVSTLPEELLQAVGTPLLIKDSNAPDGATISAVKP